MTDTVAYIVMGKYNFGNSCVAVFTNREAAAKYADSIRNLDKDPDRLYWLESTPLISQ